MGKQTLGTSKAEHRQGMAGAAQVRPHLKLSAGRAAVKVFPWANRGALAGMVLAGMALLSSVEGTQVIFGLGHLKNRDRDRAGRDV